MNRRSFIKGLAGLVAAGLWLPSTRTIIDLNPQGLPVDDAQATRIIEGYLHGPRWNEDEGLSLHGLPLPDWGGLDASAYVALPESTDPDWGGISYFDNNTRGKITNCTMVDNDGIFVREERSSWTSQRFVTLRYHQDLWPLPHVEVVIDGATVASFAGDNAHEQAMAFYNDLPSQTIVLRVHAPKHAPLRMPQGNTDA